MALQRRSALRGRCREAWPVLLCACAAALTARFQAALFCSPVPHAVEGSKLFSPPLRSRGVGESRGLPHLHAAHALRPQRVGPGVKRSALITVPLTIVNIAPPCLGFWRAEYGVSYGYGLAMALSGAWLLFAETRALSWAVALHVACLCIYGVRLSVFLLYRELCIPRFQEFRNRIEQRSKDRGTRLKRFPFLFCCGLLYLGLAAPASLAVAAADSVGKSALYQGAVALMYIGWFVAALADTWKSVAKSTQGQDALVTGGPFALLRHPNYTGEQLMWTASFVAGCCACASLPLRSSWVAALLSGLGVAGILFVLMQATRGLEMRQMEKYGTDDKYQQWRGRTWAGLSLAAKPVQGEAGSDDTPAPEGGADA